jgi:hypothetical protein
VSYLDEILKEPVKEPEEKSESVGMLDEIMLGANPTEQSAHTNIELMQAHDPDSEAKVYELSEKSGFTPDTVRIDTKKVERRVNSYAPGASKEIDGYMSQSLKKGQPNTFISGDDGEELKKTQESIFTKIRRSYRRGEENVELGSLRAAQLFGDDSAETERRIQELKKVREDVEEIEDAGIVEEALTGTAEQIPILLETFEQSAIRGFQGAVIGAGGAVLTGQAEFAGTLAKGGAKAGMKAGAAEAILKLEAGLAADEFMDFRDENGQPLDPGIVWTASITVGAVNAGLEFASLGVLLKTVPGADKFIGKFTTKRVLEALKNPTVRQKLTKVFTKYGKAVGVESLTEAAQEAFTILGGELAKKVSDEKFDPVPFELGLQRSLAAGRAAIGPTVVLGMPGSVVGVYQSVSNSHSSQDFHDNLDKDHKAVQETKTQERSRDHSKEFLKALDKQEDVYIPSKGIDSLFQAHTTEDAFEILEKVGVDPVAARETIRTGEDTAVNVGEILTLNQEDYSILEDDIKEAPGAYTRREIKENVANEDIENSSKKLQEEIEIQKPIEAEISRLESEIAKTKLADSKIAEDAPILLKGLAERLQLNGLDPAEQLKNITIKRTPFAEFVARGKQFFQTDLSRELELQIADIDARLAKITPEMEGGVERIASLEQEKVELREQIAATFPAETFFQATGKKRGAITIQGEKKLIELFEGADLSTVLHEVGHVALLEYSALEKTGQANEGLVADMKVIREWVGAKEGADLTREQSEQFARGFEAYLREGVAPTSALRVAFERFKHYLSSVYKTAKELDVTLTDDVRQVFARMVSTNIEVETAAQAGGFVAKTDVEMDALGMIPKDKAFAKRLIERTVSKAEELLTKARNKSLRALRGTWHAETREELRAENLIYDITTDIAKGGFDVDELAVIKKQVEDGEPARRIIKRDAAGEVIGVTVEGGTFPEYFKGQGFTKKETLNIINKALAGKKLTEKQITSLDILVQGYREEIGREAARAGVTLVFKDDNRFDREEFIETYGEDAIGRLPNTDVMRVGGIPIDEAGMTYAFADGDALIQAMFNAPPLNEAIDQRVAQKQAEHDAQFTVEDFISDLKSYRDYQQLIARYIEGATVDEAAVDAAIQRNINRWEKEARERNPNATPLEIDEIVQDRIKAFREKKAKPRAITQETLKRLARETMAAKTVRNAQRIDKFLSAMKKAASDERRAIMRKDWGAASTANELQRFNYEMASLSKNVRSEVNKAIKNAKRVGKLKAKETIRNEYKEAILHLISDYNLAPLSPRDPLTRPKYDSLFKGDSFGRDGFPTPDFLTGNIADYRDLRLEQMRELDNAIRYLEGQGTLAKDKVLSDGFTLIKDITGGAIQVLDKLKAKRQWEEGSLPRKVTDWVSDKLSWLDNLEFTIKSADGYTNLGKDGIKGILERNVLDLIKRGLNALTVDQKRIQAELEPHLAQIQKTNRKWQKKFKGKHIQIEGVRLPEALLANKQTKGWRDYQIWAIALNSGNKGEKSNFENLINGYDMTAGEVDTILQLLTVEDMRAIQGIWDTINSLFPQADAQFLKDNNYHMTKIEATPFRFKGENFKGGYYPIRHDARLSRNVKRRTVKEIFFDNEDAPFVTPFTRKGSTVERLQGVSLPIRLDWSVMDSHFRDTLHYIHLTDPIRDADRITRDEGFEASFIRVLGDKVYDTIRPALKHIANPRREGLDLAGGRELEVMRGLSTAYVLAWNTGVALKQPLSTFGAIHDIGLKAYLNGFASTYLTPAKHYQKMLDLSPRMRERLKSFDREIKSSFLKLSETQRGVYFGDKKVTWQDVKNFGFWQIRIADTATVLPIWHGAFNDKINADQSNLQEAIEYADNAVDASQPSARPLDLSAWQRDGGAIRLFSQFQTFTVGKYGQRQRFFYRAWKQGKLSTVDYAWFNFMDAFLPLVSMNMLFAILHGRDLGDDEEQKKIMKDVLVSWTTMGVPVLGNIARSLTTGWGDPLDSPVLETGNRFIRGVVKGVESLNGFENRKDRERALWGIAHAMSILSGVPLSKIVARAQKGAKQKKGVPGIKYLVPAHK